MASTFRQTWGVDLRSLGVLRVLLGLMILVDLLIRVVDLRAHYSDEGILPRLLQQKIFFDRHPGAFSFHLWSGDTSVQAVLFGLAALFAFILLLGYRTRLSLLMSLLLMISLQNRNMTIETGGDYLLRLICFWGLFLPLGARFSLDRHLMRGDARRFNGQRSYTSIASFALILQLGIVYVFSALHKTHPIWLVDFTAIHYALHIDAYDTWVGQWLRQYPLLTTVFTRTTLWFEFVAPFCLVIIGGLSKLYPIKNAEQLQGAVRTITVAAFIAFHFGLGISLSLGTFPWFAMMIWFAMVPTWAWNRTNEWRGRRRAQLLRSGQTSAIIEALNLLDLWRQRIETVPRKSCHLAPGEPPAPTPLSNRKSLVPKVAHGLLQAFAGLCLFYVLTWNLLTVDRATYQPIIRGEISFLPDVRPALNLLRLDQHWGLFAPYPRKSDGWYVVVGKKVNGQEIDYLQPDQRLTWRKPADVSGSYRTFRWRKYFRNIRRRSGIRNRRLYTQYVCRTYNETHSGAEKLTTVTLYFMRRSTRRSGGHSAPKKERLRVQECGSSTEQPHRRRPTEKKRK